MFCPKCKTHRAHRSHRVGLREQLAGIFGFKAYRCRQCGRRYLLFRAPTPELTTGAPSSTEREIRQTRAAVEKVRARREALVYGLALALVAVFIYFMSRQSSQPDIGP